MFVNINSLSQSAKIMSLARLAHILTVCARSTYEAGTENVREPKVLRAYNELQHRVTGAVRDHIMGRGGISLETVIQMMHGFGVEHNRVEEIGWALKTVEEMPLPIEQ
jgi:hypothetical protein